MSMSTPPIITTFIELLADEDSGEVDLFGLWSNDVIQTDRLRDDWKMV